MKTWQLTHQQVGKYLLINKIYQTTKMPVRFYGKCRPAQHGHERSLKRKQLQAIPCFIKRNGPTLVIAILLLGFIFIAPTFGVAIEDLKAPIKDLKDTLFGGWMWIPKIGAAVGGCLLAVYNQSIMPLATGAAIGLGIHFYDLYIKADGALI